MEEERILKLLREILREELSRFYGWPRWLPTREASRYSGLSPKKLRELAREGEIYAVETSDGGKLLFDRESIDEYFLREKARLEAHLELLKRSGLC